MLYLHNKSYYNNLAISNMKNKIFMFLAFIIFSCNSKKENNSDKMISLNETFTISDFDLKSINNIKIEENKLLLLDFWATWCGPCIASFPHLEKVQEKYKEELQIIAISDEKIETVENYLKKNKVNLSFLNDTEEKVFNFFNIQARPTSCLISEKGEFLWIGNSKKIENVLNQYLSSGSIAESTINELNKAPQLQLKQNTSIYQYSISEATDPSKYFAKNQKGENQIINLKYISVPLTEIIQDFLNVGDLNFSNNKPELETILLNLEAKSKSPNLIYGDEKIKILEDIQSIYNFSISRKNQIVDVYMLKVNDSIVLHKNIETIEGGGMVNRKNGNHEITRLNLSELAYYFQKRLKVHIQYNGDNTGKYNLKLKEFKSVNQLNILLKNYGLGLLSNKSEIEFIEID